MSPFLRHVAVALGGEVCPPNAVLCPGPGHSPRDRSLKVSFFGNGEFVCHSFSGDDWKTCKDHVKQLLGIRDDGPRREPPPAVERAAIPDEDQARRVAFALQIWRAAGPPGKTIANYLESRSLWLPDDMLDGESIRYHGSCPFRLEDDQRVHLPAMVCLFRDVVTNEPCGIHRTALEPDGGSKSKRFKDSTNCRQMLGRASSAAIKLSPDEEVTHGLAIAEGVENALAAICGRLRPVWALGSSTFIKSFRVLNAVQNLTVLADNDKAGLSAARTCAQRWADAGREAVVTYPPKPGTDWNDAFREERA